MISGLEDISNTEIHFSSPNDTKGAYVVLPVIENGIALADIPNILLTVSGRIDVFVYRNDHTCVRGVFVVAPREKPDDYVYTETEVWRYEKFVEQLNGKEDTANRVTTVDDSSDDKHYPTAKAVYKAIPKSLKNPNSLTFTGAVTGSYDGSKPMTFNIPSGGGGTDISLGLTGAAVGDIIKVKAVDVDGKPTEWEAYGWRKLKEFTLPDDPSTDTSDIKYVMSTYTGYTDKIAQAIFSKDENGNAFDVQDILLIANWGYAKSSNYFGMGDQNSGLGYGNIFCNRLDNNNLKQFAYISMRVENYRYTLKAEPSAAMWNAYGIFTSPNTIDNLHITTIKLGTFLDQAMLPGSSFVVYGR